MNIQQQREYYLPELRAKAIWEAKIKCLQSFQRQSWESLFLPEVPLGLGKTYITVGGIGKSLAKKIAKKTWNRYMKEKMVE